ncbi:39S ribosomal protein L19, mitochondrial-like [Penaeus japonicus]|uniref:39S ribosomal protein L19, mitochondrial-like n=1 Tax=Penaeus japonicus TaxID=27405 RepID=UPI001C715371|nr:39S ribosomal protein L19, mitochondrial-like [Penaeus japonicus]
MAGSTRQGVLSLTRKLAGLELSTRRAVSTATSKVLPYVSSTDHSGEKKKEVPHDFRVVFPDFLPDPKPEFRNKLREKLERRDMLNRRNIMEIPEFYVGSIMAVTVADFNASGKSNRFVGICIQRGGAGLRAWFILRNVIDHQGECVSLFFSLSCSLSLLKFVLILILSFPHSLVFSLFLFLFLFLSHL